MASNITDPKNIQKLAILAVDDIEENLELLDVVLSESGYDVVTAKDGVDALNRLNSQTVHLIVADAMMPKMDGFQLCKQVKSNPLFRSIPFIIYTGNYIEEDEIKFAESLGVDRYVVKYAGLGSLMDAVNELIKKYYAAIPIVQENKNNEITDQLFLEKHHQLLGKKLEEKMKELELSEAHYRNFFDNASMAIFVLNPSNGHILEVNNRAKELLHISDSNSLEYKELPFEDPNLTKEKIIGIREFTQFETKLVKIDGKKLDAELSVGPILQPRGKRIIVYAQDISEQKKIKEQLFQAEKMTLMGKLASGIAHEIRNPLAAIRLNVQYLMQKNELDVSTKEIFDGVLDSAQRIEQIIENTLGLARPTPPQMNPVDINELLNKVFWFVKVSVQQKNIQFITEMEKNLPRVSLDLKQIQQVFLNLLQNAIDASPQNGSVQIKTSYYKKGQDNSGVPKGFIKVVIKDHGPGMTKEMLNRLFEAFVTTKIGGTGLGLALSKQILDKHGAIINIESPSSGGLQVDVLFPISE